MAEYSTAFKRHTVEKSHQPGVTVAGLAADVGVHPATLYRWRAAVRENPAEPFLDPAERQAREEARLAAERAAQEASLDQLIAEARANGRLPHHLEHLGIVDHKYQPDLARARHDGQTLMNQRIYYTRIWRFIDQHSADYPVQRLCGRLMVSRSGYYRWVQRQPGENGRIAKRARPPETYPPIYIDLLYSQAQLHWARQGADHTLAALMLSRPTRPTLLTMPHALDWLPSEASLGGLLDGLTWEEVLEVMAPSPLAVPEPKESSPEQIEPPPPVGDEVMVGDEPLVAEEETAVTQPPSLERPWVISPSSPVDEPVGWRVGSVPLPILGDGGPLTAVGPGVARPLMGEGGGRTAVGHASLALAHRLPLDYPPPAAGPLNDPRIPVVAQNQSGHLTD